MSLSWYRWYPTDFAGDARVRLMPCQTRGAYRDLLDLSWEVGALKAPEKALKQLGWSPKLWADISPCWRYDRRQKGYVQARLEAERKDAEKRHAGACKASAAAAARRKKKGPR